MKRSRLILLAVLPVLAGCATSGGSSSSAARIGGEVARDHHATVVGALGVRELLKGLAMWTGEYRHAAMVAYAIYDPFAPTWRISATVASADTVALQLSMKRLISGGEGEARQVFLRAARQMVEEGGYAGFDVLRYEEGIESTRPFAHRTAMGEIRLVGSRQFPTLNEPATLTPVRADAAAQ